MDEVSLTQKFVNLFLLMGGIFAVFYALIYGAFWLGHDTAYKRVMGKPVRVADFVEHSIRPLREVGVP